MSWEGIIRRYDEWLTAVTDDMVEHLPTLRHYAAMCARVTEFGVYDCTSTWGLLAGRPQWMRSYDIIRRAEVDEVETEAAGTEIDYKFITGGTHDVEIEETDLLFIDSLHTYQHLRVELAMHAAKAKRFIIMHDTVTFGDVDQFGQPPGLNKAIDEHLAACPEWRLRERFSNCNGLTILERVT